MGWKWTDHFKLQMIERSITEHQITSVLDEPDAIIRGDESRTIYQKLIGGKLLRVITENDALITACFTGKIEKYTGD